VGERHPQDGVGVAAARREATQPDDDLPTVVGDEHRPVALEAVDDGGRPRLAGRGDERQGEDQCERVPGGGHTGRWPCSETRRFASGSPLFALG